MEVDNLGGHMEYRLSWLGDTPSATFTKRYAIREALRIAIKLQCAVDVVDTRGRWVLGFSPSDQPYEREWNV